MKLLFQLLFLFLTWFTNLSIATPAFVKVVLPSYELTLSKTENVKEESITKISFQNFARCGIDDGNKPAVARVSRVILQ